VTTCRSNLSSGYGIWDMGYGMDIFMDGRRGRRRTLHRRVPGAIFNQKSITSAYVGYVWLERVGESGRRSMECIRASSLCCVMRGQEPAQLVNLCHGHSFLPIPLFGFFFSYFFFCYGCHMAMTMTYDWWVGDGDASEWVLGLAPFCQAILKP